MADIRLSTGVDGLDRLMGGIRRGSTAHKAYRAHDISERHRHRYEFNNRYREVFESKGIVFSGLSPDRELVEMLEIPEHPWFVATQFHPEFKSYPTSPHPLFREFVRAALKRRQGQ